MKRALLSAVAALALMAGQAEAQMITPLMVDAGVTSPSVSANRYLAPAAGSIGSTSWISSLASVSTPLAGASGTTWTLSNYVVYCPTTMTQGTWDFPVQKNGASSAITAECNTSQSIGSGGGGTLSFSPGDTIAFGSVPTGTPTAEPYIAIGALFTSGSNNQSLLFFGHASASTTTALSMAPQSGADTTGTITTRFGVAPSYGTVSSMVFHLGVAPGTGAGVTYTLYKNGSATSCTQSFGATDSTLAPVACSVSFNPGDTIAVVRTITGSPTAAYGVGSIEWDATTNGEAPQFTSVTNTPVNAGSRYMDASGETSIDTTQANHIMITPAIITAKDMYSVVGVAPGASKSVSFTWQSGASPPTLSPSTLVSTVSGTNTAGTPDTTDTPSVTIHQFVNIAQGASGSPTVQTGGNAASWVAIASLPVTTGRPCSISLKGVCP